MNILADYIQNIRQITITAAAIELGYTRQYVGRVCNGLNAGRVFGELVEKWSAGVVRKEDVMWQKRVNKKVYYND